MGVNDKRLIMTQVDWGTALSAVMMFLQEPLPSTVEDQQLVNLQQVIAAARQRLREQKP